jgi:hypothetical protein
VSFWVKRAENETNRQKKTHACQFQGFKENIRRFYQQTDRASFPYAVMSMVGAYRFFGKEY